MTPLVLRSLRVLIDLGGLSVAYVCAFLFRFELDFHLEILKLLFFTWPYVIVFQYLTLVFFGVPEISWRFFALKDLTRIFAALAVATGALVVLRLVGALYGGYFRFVTIPLGVLAMDFVLAFLCVAGVRAIRRVIAERTERHHPLPGSAITTQRTLLIGAGRAGVLVARELRQNPRLGLEVVGFVDDDPHKQGLVIEGAKVLGASADLPRLRHALEVAQAVIAIASATGESIRRLVDACKAIDLPVRIVPGVFEILDGTVAVTRLREVTIEDLLRRPPVELDRGGIGRFLAGKTVLVTGAGGSIGAELCRQVARFGPRRLVLLEQAENALFVIHQELRRTCPGLDLVPAIADVCDSRRVDALFAAHTPHVVFHAAAHKHVPMMEWNPGEAIKNNVFGTRKVADAADRHGAEAFVMISTDKAVRPTSVMGASKRVAELYVQSLQERSPTKFVAVRFGNVLGSAGSVIPIFQEQIRRGGPVTVTHEEMRRYFMTIPEACQLVMQAATMGQGSEIFVLDMGEPVRIVDLARDLIRLSGYSEREIAIEFTGLRPGEKLFEELATSAEEMDRTLHAKIFVGRIPRQRHEAVVAGLEELARVTDGDDLAAIARAFQGLVPEIRPADAAEAVLTRAPPRG